MNVEIKSIQMLIHKFMRTLSARLRNTI